MKVGGQRKLTVPSKVQLFQQTCAKLLFEVICSYPPTYTFLSSLDTGPVAALLRFLLMLFFNLTSNSWLSNNDLESNHHHWMSIEYFFNNRHTLFSNKKWQFLLCFCIFGISHEGRLVFVFFFPSCNSYSPTHLVFGLVVWSCIWIFTWGYTGWASAIPYDILYLSSPLVYGFRIFAPIRSLFVHMRINWPPLWYLGFHIAFSFTWGCTSWAFGFPSCVFLSSYLVFGLAPILNFEFHMRMHRLGLWLPIWYLPRLNPQLRFCNIEKNQISNV